MIAYAADRQMTHVRKFQSGQYSQQSQKLLNELAQARLCLLNAKKKAAYDEQLRAKLGVAAGEGEVGAGVAAPRPSTKPVASQPHAPPPPPTTAPPPTAPPPTATPQPAPPQSAPPQPAPPQSAPPVATMEPPTPVPVAKATAKKNSMAVRTGPVAATARRSRNRSQGPIVVALCVIAGLGLLAVVLAVALNSEIDEADGNADSVPFVASPPIVVQPHPAPPRKHDKPPKKTLPQPPQPDHTQAVTPPPDETVDDTSGSDPEESDTPPPNLDDPQRTAKIEEALTAAEQALAGRDVSEALAEVETARLLQYNGAEKQHVADLEELLGLHMQFWQAVDRGIKRLKNGDEIGFQSNISNFVSADEENITLLITGNRMTTKLRELEVPFLIALAERGLSRSDPKARLVIAAFLAVDNRDPSPEHLDYARKMLAEAAAGGATSKALKRRLTPQKADPALPKPGED